jgi:hypothetical protein
MFVNGSGRNEQSQQRTFHRWFLPSFGSLGQTVSEEKNLTNQPIRNKNRLWRPCLLTDRDEMSNRNRGLSIDASYQVLVHLAKRFQRRKFFRNQPARNKNCLWRPCLLTDRDEMSNRNRGLPIDDSMQQLLVPSEIHRPLPGRPCPVLWYRLNRPPPPSPLICPVYWCLFARQETHYILSPPFYP